MSASAAARAARLFPPEERPGRLPSEHRTVTMGGFLKNPIINGRYTERFGAEYVVNGRETYWSDDLEYFIYLCSWHSRWYIFSSTKLEAVRDDRMCYYTAASPVDAELVDSALPKGWSEWDGQQLIEVPTAGLHILSTQEWLEDFSPGSYDSVDIHPECKRPPYQPIEYSNEYTGNLSERDTMFSYQAENQGTCSNCWAIASAALIERLLCMHGAGKWVGPRTAISAAYITSCASSAVSGDNGCEGGNALKALQWVGEHGVPTGGDHGDRKTCVPMFRTYSDKTSVAPACPTKCVNSFYPRSLEEDLFIPEGLKYTWLTTAFESATLALLFSPIMIIIPLYEDFYEYKGGMYNHTWGKYIMDHIMVATGYSGDRIQGFNTWGANWGHAGMYWVNRSFVKHYIIPGQIEGLGAGYPYPLPKAANEVVVSGFSETALNGHFELFTHEYGKVRGLDTYWKTDHLVLYWCHRKMFFAIAKIPESVDWPGVPSYLAKNCPWQAHGPVLEKYAPINNLGSKMRLGWVEGADSDAPVLPEAGIVEVIEV